MWGSIWDNENNVGGKELTFTRHIILNQIVLYDIISAQESTVQYSPTQSSISHCSTILRSSLSKP